MTDNLTLTKINKTDKTTVKNALKGVNLTANNDLNLSLTQHKH